MSRRSEKKRPARAVAAVALFGAWFAGGLAAAAAVRGLQSAGSPGAAGGAAPAPAPVPAPATVRPPAGPRARSLEQADALFQKGVQLLEAERFADALEELRRASELDPTDPRPHHGMGKIYAKLFLQDKAEESYRRAIAADGAYRPSKEALAMLLHEKGRHEEAMAILRGLERETPQDPFVRGELAINCLAVGRTQDALDLLEKYVAARPKDAWGRAHLGRALEASGHRDRAEAAYREALALDPRFSTAFYWLAQLLVAAGRGAEAEPLLEAYRRLRQLATDEHQLRMALLGNPDDVPTLARLAQVLALLGKPEEALAAVERARNLAPADPRLEELHDRLSRPRGGR